MRKSIVCFGMLLLGCPDPGANDDGIVDEGGTEETGTAETGTAETGTAETGTAETGTAEETGGGECIPAQDGVPRTYEVELFGFSEIENGMPTNTDLGLDYVGTCVVASMDFSMGTLSLGLDCEHPAPSLPEGASVSITTAAAGLPAGVDVGDSLTFEAYAIESQGGDGVGPVVQARLLQGVNVEVYQLYDADGPIFAANARGLWGSFGEVMVSDRQDCPTWQGCSSGDDLAGYIQAEAGGAPIEVHIGEVGLLEGGAGSWDVSLFQAVFDPNDCHFGISGDFSVVRRP